MSGGGTVPAVPLEPAKLFGNQLFDDAFYASKNTYLSYSDDLQEFGRGYVQHLKAKAIQMTQTQLDKCKKTQLRVDDFTEAIKNGEHTPSATSFEKIETETDLKCLQRYISIAHVMIEYRLAEQFFGGTEAGAYDNSKASVSHVSQAFTWLRFLKAVREQYDKVFKAEKKRKKKERKEEAASGKVPNEADANPDDGPVPRQRTGGVFHM
jgi:hypothetical protein|tara:strand:- start:344 stop:970 length:627 start_codon:yes stop_codon:yes gene_type:complete